MWCTFVEYSNCNNLIKQFYIEFKIVIHKKKFKNSKIKFVDLNSKFVDFFPIYKSNSILFLLQLLLSLMYRDFMYYLNMSNFKSFPLVKILIKFKMCVFNSRTHTLINLPADSNDFYMYLNI